jgi:anaerobic ribonucleoside-triphosphate reductase
MKIVKRDGTIVDYNSEKISTAIGKANNEVKPKERATKEQINDIITYVESLGKKRMLVEDIQDIIEEKLMEFGKYALAKEYITYRYKRDLVRKSNTTDQTIKELLEGDSEYWNNENSNKDAKAVTVLRDYIAGVTSTDITRRFLLPEDVVKAHDEGIIHFHDADYFAQPIHNCELINLEDMLQNGTNINGVMIEKPHKFITACTIATQIILGVSSSSYGGATVSLTHLAPFVRDSYNRYYEEVSKEFESIHILGDLSNEEYENKIKEIAMQRTRKEVEAGVQTFNYQVNSMTNTNGQAPFLSVCMYLGETDEYKEELAMIIEEFLKQRILGFKNKKGVYVTPAFPKLLYVLEEDNIHEDSKYWYLTELAAKCTAKRLVPDYISEKVMKENKINQYGDGDCYPCMGAVKGDEIVSIKVNEQEFNDITVEEAFKIINACTPNHGGGFNNPSEITKFKDKCGIYKITHIPSGKYYIGSSKNIHRRLCEHRARTTHMGTLGDNYYIADFDINNYKYELLEECSIDELLSIESQYIDLSDELCVNFKDCICNGNFDSNNCLNAMKGSSYSTFSNRAFTWIKRTDNFNVYIKSRQHWEPVLAILHNFKNKCPLKLYAITFIKDGVEQTLHVTEDHPLHTNLGRVETIELTKEHKLMSTDTKTLYDIIDIELDNDTYDTYDFEVSNDIFDLSGIISHNCRSFLTPWTVKGNPSKALNYQEGKGKYYGRFNQGVVTINLPDVGLSANKDMDKFWKILDERLDICHKALQCRHNRLKNVQAKRAPLLWQYGALARLDKDDTIEPLLLNNYSTLSLGYAGLYECVKAMTGKSHTDPEGKEFGLKIMQHLNDKCTEWKQAESIGYSLYGTPIESTTYKFAKCLKQRFGEDVFEKLDGKDRNYITNSYHVPVFEEIDAFEKLGIESEFQRLSPGGAISYVETPNLQNNTEAILEVMKFIYDNIMYAELNTKSDYCQKCGYDGEILIDENLEWYCPNCGNRDHDTLNVARRTCGYIGSNFWNKGRTQEIKERVLHLDNKDA